MVDRPQGPPYINGMNKYYTKQLFYEEWNGIQIDSRTIHPVFTLYKDKPGYINFGRHYINSGDPTGYTTSKELLGDYAVWQSLLGCHWFNAAKEVWDRELDAKLQSEGFQAIRKLALSDKEAVALAASKYLSDKLYRKDHVSGKGRPKKEDVAREAKKMAVTESDLAADLKRIMGGRP